MRVLQGSIVGSSFLVMAIGYTGAMGALLRFLSPVVVAPTVCMVGRCAGGGGGRGLRRRVQPSPGAAQAGGRCAPCEPPGVRPRVPPYR